MDSENEEIVTGRDLPTWCAEGVKVVVIHPARNDFSEGEIVRVTENSAYVTSPDWPASYEKRFVCSRWTHKSDHKELEEFGNRVGFASSYRCVPADGRTAQKAIATRARRESVILAQTACAQFSATPSTAKARETVKKLEAFLNVMEDLRA